MFTRTKAKTLVTASIILVLSICIPGTTGQSTVEEGAPLHLYIKKAPTEEDIYLDFQPPSETYTDLAKNNLTYRKTLGPKDGVTSSNVVYFPRAPQSNFLQFEPNASVRAHYNFTVSAIQPSDVSDLDYDLKVTVAMARKKGEEYDDGEIVFHIRGKADSRRRVMEGDIDVDTDSLRSFDGKNGGRLKVTIEREDDLNTTVTLYCGYQGKLSHFQLPFSKYTYVPSEDNDGNSWGIYILIGLAAIGVIAAIITFRRGEEKGGKGTDDKNNENARSPRSRKRGGNR